MITMTNVASVACVPVFSGTLVQAMPAAIAEAVLSMNSDFLEDNDGWGSPGAHIRNWLEKHLLLVRGSRPSTA